MATNLTPGTGVPISRKEAAVIIALIVCGAYGICKNAIKNGYSFHISFDNNGKPLDISFSSPETVSQHKNDQFIDD